MIEGAKKKRKDCDVVSSCFGFLFFNSSSIFVSILVFNDVFGTCRHTSNASRLVLRVNNHLRRRGMAEMKAEQNIDGLRVEKGKFYNQLLLSLSKLHHTGESKRGRPRARS